MAHSSLSSVLFSLQEFVYVLRFLLLFISTYILCGQNECKECFNFLIFVKLACVLVYDLFYVQAQELLRRMYFCSVRMDCFVDTF